MRILLVEDDQDIGNVLAQFLELQNFKVLLARNGNEGLVLFKKNEVDICILDIMMPKMDGFSLAQKIKKIDAEMPLLFLTAKNQKEDIIKGLKLGADDYICKPFEVEELVLRIQNILKRTKKIDPEIFPVGSCKFSFDKLQLISPNKIYNLTRKEAELLKYFLTNKNKILKREQILSELWGENDYFLGRSMDVFISRIRKYLKPVKNVSIDTVRGVGFVFREKIK